MILEQNPTVVFLLAFSLWFYLLVNINGKMAAGLNIILNTKEDLRVKSSMVLLYQFNDLKIYQSNDDVDHRPNELKWLGVMIPLILVSMLVSFYFSGYEKFTDLFFILLAIGFFTCHVQPMYYRLTFAETLTSLYIESRKLEGVNPLTYELFNAEFNKRGLLTGLRVAFIWIIIIYILIAGLTDNVFLLGITCASLLNVITTRLYLTKLVFKCEVPNWVRMSYGGFHYGK